MAARNKVPVDLLRDAEFDRAFELLRGLVDRSAVDREFPLWENVGDIASAVLGGGAAAPLLPGKIAPKTSCVCKSSSVTATTITMT